MKALKGGLEKMSEFECCGELMTRNKEGRLTCKRCGGHRPKTMDGLTGQEWERKEKYEREHETEIGNDLEEGGEE